MEEKEKQLTLKDLEGNPVIKENTQQKNVLIKTTWILKVILVYIYSCFTKIYRPGNILF